MLKGLISFIRGHFLWCGWVKFIFIVASKIKVKGVGSKHGGPFRFLEGREFINRSIDSGKPVIQHHMILRRDGASVQVEN